MSSPAPIGGATVPVQATHRFDESRLAEWMRSQVAGFEGPISVTQFKGGQSNPTYRIATPSRSYVLRRKPPGALLKGAHAVDREARVMRALATAGFPVPHVRALCTDDAVLGSWFYVMDMVEGRILWDASFAELPRPERAPHLDAVNATIAALHSIDPVSVGLDDYGRHGTFVERQVARWSRQYRDDGLAGRNVHMDRLIDWLECHVPASDQTSMVHGDFRLDNLVFHPHEPRVLAVLDWELSTLGHPLADFAYNAMMYRMPREILGGIGGVDLQAMGLPTEAAYVDAYCRRTGRNGIEDLDFYIVFNLFRFAAIVHGIRGRVLRGTAANPDAHALASRFERIAELAWSQVPAGTTSGRAGAFNPSSVG